MEAGRHYMADSTDDESITGGDDPSIRQDHRVPDNAKATGRVGWWRCCNSGPPPPITEAVEDAAEDSQAKASELAGVAVLAARGENGNEHQHQQQRDSPAVVPHRWCGSAICAPRIEDEIRDPNTGEDSFAVQERGIEAAGGLQRLGSNQPDNIDQSPTTMSLPGPGAVEPIVRLEPEREPETEVDPNRAQPVQQSELEQIDEGGGPLHRRTNSGVIKM